ncbi:hypothetical protein QO002_000542 [Pararhizobium capsulatum DSM 1112]|uniref:Uncharacterized protein n=1 Tax=Pararhizobium capsulatum DSM 1112 TaxID=1121113 RepID=A0ABU0BJH6_9HYPH|nr:hypothetical protein [Pararhizobium capsulatum]MDQ0318404.1 hypothetical protein [Pararhizobium capsulatum DSM 1112]
MGFGPARPPVTEDVAGVIVKDIKSGEGHSATSEVPLAFQTGRPPTDPVVLGDTRKQMMMFGLFAFCTLAVLLAVWALA